ncbi:hypothetical protein [Pyrobaculum islandicum]|nr:hypothetical protein [Pyrobaculum islandicum]
MEFNENTANAPFGTAPRLPSPWEVGKQIRNPKRPQKIIDI